MENSEQTTKQAPWLVIAIISSVILIAGIWFFTNQEEPKQIIEVAEEIKPEISSIEVVSEPIEEVIEPIEEVVEEVIEETIAPVLPLLDESDEWVQEKLPSLTWRKELLSLVINEDMIRRFVVFTDNFSQGLVAYEHSPFVTPVSPFSVIENKKENNSAELLWDENSVRRFTLYVDLLRSFETETLVAWYIELKPLINQAYGELGYPDEDFTEVLQSAITRVLDMELPKEPLELERPSVMYRFKNKSVESLNDSDKLLLRLGKENLLIIKSVLLEINEKLSREVGS